MISLVKRALHISGASCLLLCGMNGSAMSQDAAAPSATQQLPEITVTAPSPIVRRKLAPSRTPVRVARAVPSRNRDPAPQAQPTPAPTRLVRRRRAPPRPPARVARPVPSRNREPAPQAQPTPAPAAPQQGVLP